MQIVPHTCDYIIEGKVGEMKKIKKELKTNHVIIK